MNAFVHKEIRSLLPASLWAALLASLPSMVAWFASQDGSLHDTNDLFVPFGFGILLLVISSFGQEFNAGTFSILLAQPIPRERLWRIKVGLLSLACLIISAIFLVGLALVPRDSNKISHGAFLFQWAIVCVPLVTSAFAGGLWTTLLTRQIAAAFWITVLVPALICLLVAIPFPEANYTFYLVSALLIYSVAGYFGARRLFLSAQDTQWAGGNIPIPAWFAGKSSAAGRPVGSPRKPLRALFWKEIQSHHVSLLLGAIVFALHVLIVILRKLNPALTEPNKITSAVLGLWFILWFTLPFLIGSQAVAEDRKLGTLESQLCLPISRLRQILVKFIVAISLSVLLSAVMPWVIEGTGILSGVRGSPFDVFFAPKDLSILAVISAGIAAFSFYASTLTRNTLQSMGAAVLICLLASTFILFTNSPRELFPGSPRGLAPLFGIIGGVALSHCLITLAFNNYKQVWIDSKLWLRNGLAITGVVLFAYAAAALTYNRFWENFTTFEPTHGPARLTGSVKPEICLAGRNLFVLLPDGRLWVSQKSERRLLFNYFEVSQIKRPTYTYVPVAGDFVGGSNWAMIDNRYSFRVVALKADGSLWTSPRNGPISTHHPR